MVFAVCGLSVISLSRSSNRPSAAIQQPQQQIEPAATEEWKNDQEHDKDTATYHPSGKVPVRGYYNKNGKWVAGYERGVGK